jgi:hypothetical protein
VHNGPCSRRHTYCDAPLFANAAIQAALSQATSADAADVEGTCLALLLAALPFPVLLVHAAAFVVAPTAPDKQVRAASVLAGASR